MHVRRHHTLALLTSALAAGLAPAAGAAPSPPSGPMGLVLATITTVLPQGVQAAVDTLPQDPAPRTASATPRPPASPATPRRAGPGASAPAPEPAPPLRVGVYPWAGVGAIEQVAEQRPDAPEQALAAVRRLQGDRPFVVHLYGQYTGTDPGETERLLSDARWWSENGLQVEAVLRYRPASAEMAAGYVPWVRETTKQLAAIGGTVAVQVGNEANERASAAAADGAYPGAVRAIARAAPVAKAALRDAGRDDVRIGINWAAGTSPCTTGRFWRALRSAGGRAFRRSVDWVGLDAYPGTWSAPSRTEAPDPAAVATTMTTTLRCLRRKHMPAAGLPASTTITVAETGWPTSPERSEETQDEVLRSIVGAVHRVRGTFGVTDLRWFSLRDANTGSGQLENGYGLLRDDHTEKPAFASLQRLVRTGTP